MHRGNLAGRGDRNAFTDEEIARILRSGNDRSMNDFCEFFAHDSLGYVLGYLINIGAQKADALDATQTVLGLLATWSIPHEKLYNSNHNSGASFRTWFTAAAKRAWLVMKEKHRHEVSLNNTEAVRIYDESSNNPDDEEDRAREEKVAAYIERFKSELPMRDQIIVNWYLKHVDRPDWAGLAEILEGTQYVMSVSNIRVQFHRLCKRAKANGPPTDGLAGKVL